MPRHPIVDTIVERLAPLRSEGVVVLHEPRFVAEDAESVRLCVESGFVSSVGEQVRCFEQQLAAYTGATDVVATVNGTSALHLALLACGVGRDDEVIVPTISFVATTNAVHYCGATPHFVDSSLDTLGVDPQALEERLRSIAIKGPDGTHNRETGRRIGAAIVVHTLGHPANASAIREVCDRYAFPLIEDAAAALGSFSGGTHTGRFGHVGAMSFNGNKIITTGGGGAVLSDAPDVIERVRFLATTAREPHPWRYRHPEVGFNYRMPSLNATLGSSQMTRLECLVKQKRALASWYEQQLSDIPGCRVFMEPPGARSNYWLNAILLSSNEVIGLREELLEALHEVQLLARPAWEPLHRMAIHATAPRASLRTAEEIEKRLVCLPSSPHLVEIVRSA